MISECGSNIPLSPTLEAGPSAHSLPYLTGRTEARQEGPLLGPIAEGCAGWVLSSPGPPHLYHIDLLLLPGPQLTTVDQTSEEG